MLPVPTTLDTVRVARSSSASFFEMCSPSPVPSSLLFVVLALRSNALKIRTRSALGMPGPVSHTEIRMPPSGSGGMRTICTTPVSVNLIALLTRLIRICRSTRWSAVTTIGASGPSMCSLMPLPSAKGCNDSTTSSVTARQSTGSSATCTRPDSIFARSRRSLMMDSRCLPLVCTRRSWCSCSALSGPGSFISMVPVKPMMALSGVRSSWLMLARKLSLAWLARSSSTFCSCRSSSKRRRSVISRTAAMVSRPPGVSNALRLTSTGIWVPSRCSADTSIPAPTCPASTGRRPLGIRISTGCPIRSSRP